MKKTLALALVCYLAAVGAGYFKKSYYPPILREEILVVPPFEVSELLSLDHRGFLADLYLIQVNVHSGSMMWKPLKIRFDNEWAYGMVDLITDLDPQYRIAYLLAGMGLIHSFDDVNRAKPILEKGMKVFPDDWELPFWIGYSHYAYLWDYETAGKYLWIASQKPDSPKYFMAMMTAALSEVGNYEKAAQAMQILMDEAPNETRKIIYGKRVIRLNNLAFLQKAVKEFEKRHGRLPESPDELVTSGLIKELPPDPWEIGYQIDPEKGIIKMITRTPNPKQLK